MYMNYYKIMSNFDFITLTILVYDIFIRFLGAQNNYS